MARGAKGAFAGRFQDLGLWFSDVGVQSSGSHSGGFSFSVGASVGGLVLSVLGLVGCNSST